MERELVGTTVMLYGLVPVMGNGALLIIEKESSKRQGRKRENQMLISTGLLTHGHDYEFTRINNQSKVV